jgi:hypothetical protein
MSDIIRLPVERFRHIRSWLYYNKDIGRFADNDHAFDIDRFILYEAQWSWNNFLSATNSEDWKCLRKKTMIWSLNSEISFKYFVNTGFRLSLQSRTEHPHHQIECKITFQNKLRLSNSLSELLHGNSLGYLSIKNCSLEALPSCGSLHTLVLTDCDNLKEMGITINSEP